MMEYPTPDIPTEYPIKNNLVRMPIETYTPEKFVLLDTVTGQAWQWREDRWMRAEKPDWDAVLAKIRATPYHDPETGVTASYDPFRAQAAHVMASHAVDRSGWTRRQWVDDAKKLFNDADGSVADLVNGHIVALLAEMRALEEGRRR